MMKKLDGCLQGIKEVREQQAPWHLTEGQRQELHQSLLGHNAKIEVRVIPGDRNAAIFGQDLISLLAWCRWDVNARLITDYGLNPAIAGLTIIVNHADFAEAAFLQNLFPTVGIETYGSVKNDEHGPPNDMIWIAIGGRPSGSAPHF